MPLRRGLRLDMLFKLLDALAGRLQRLLLDDHGLREEVRPVRLLPHVVGDQPVGFGIARCAGVVAHAVEHPLQQLALFG